jgi:hypothetical protein
VAELRAEYEMTMRKRDQEKLLAMTHPEVGASIALFLRTSLFFSSSSNRRMVEAPLSITPFILSIRGGWSWRWMPQPYFRRMNMQTTKGTAFKLERDSPCTTPSGRLILYSAL